MPMPGTIKSYSESLYKQAQAEHIRIQAILKNLFAASVKGNTCIQVLIKQKEDRLLQLEKDYPALKQKEGEIK